MSARRRSKRTSAVTKGRLLEEKLEKRRIESQERASKARLKQIQNSTEKEAASTENLAIGNQLAENLDVEDPGDKSLEWDHSEDTPPSFSNETWNSRRPALLPPSLLLLKNRLQFPKQTSLGI